MGSHGTGGANHLAGEKSPYLLQHASNPVDWYPWGEEALERARSEQRPIFLSVGYSTCHWCHVMERESFENEEVAHLLNEAFICVKVDREERPDIDGLYMTAAQLMTGRGGWPLTVLLTPSLEPFYAATYIPRASRPGLIGMLELVPRVRELWSSRRADIEQSAGRVAAAMAEAVAHAAPAARVDADAVLRRGFEELSAAYDPEHGGFGPAPKFPTPHNLVFLARYARRSGEPAALSMADHTLRRMRLGGIYDHVGLGFHRYSTDAQWLVPHFEKMLYDQALLADAALELHQATGREEHARTAREVLAYLRRDMRSPEGAYYSAEDADSEGEEGRFYLWTADEIRRELGEKASAVITLMGVREGGNFASEAGAAAAGANILHRSPASDQGGLPDQEWESCRRILLAARGRRPRPLRDDKVLTDWNGLAIAALARGGRVLGDPGLVEAAAAAAAFVLERLRGSDGRLLHRYRDGDAALEPSLDDYAFVIRGLVELHQASLATRWLGEALALADRMIADFWDAGSGGLFFTPASARPLIARRKESYDHATPSGNSVAACELLRLARLAGRSDLEERSRAILESFSDRLAGLPQHHTCMLAALDSLTRASVEVVIAGDDPVAAARVLAAEHLSQVVLLGKRGDDPLLAAIAPFTAGMRSLEGRTTWYVCRDHACELPTTDPAAALEMVRQVSAVN